MAGIISLRGGAYTAAATFLLAGVPGMLTAPPWTPLWYGSLASVIVAAGLLLWATTVHGRPWWQYLPGLIGKIRQSIVGRDDGLYVGRFVVSDTSVSAHHSIVITAIVFNGTGKRVSIISASGSILINLKLVSPGDLEIKLPTPPTLLPPVAQDIQPATEFSINLSQSLPPNLAALYQTHMAAGATAQFMLQDLNILAETPKWRFRVPLWDGVVFKGGAVIGQVKCMVAKASLGVRARAG